MRISDWSSDVCSSDLHHRRRGKGRKQPPVAQYRPQIGQASPRQQQRQDQQQRPQDALADDLHRVHMMQQLEIDRQQAPQAISRHRGDQAAADRPFRWRKGIQRMPPPRNSRSAPNPATIRQKLRPPFLAENMPTNAPSSAIGTSSQLSAPSSGKTAGIIRMRVTRPIRADSMLSMIAPMALRRSEEHTSELHSLMRISSAVFCLKNK